MRTSSDGDQRKRVLYDDDDDDDVLYGTASQPARAHCFCVRVPAAAAAAISAHILAPFAVRRLAGAQRAPSHNFVLKGIKLLTRPLAPCDEPFVFARAGAARFNYVKTV